MSRAYPPFPFSEVAALGFVLAVAAAAAGLAAWLGEDWLLWWEARDWQPAQCKIVQTRMDPGGFQYAYEIAGARHLSHSISIGESSGAAVLQPGAAAVGDRVDCWVDPRDPARSLIDRDHAAGWLLPGACLLAAFLLVHGLRGVGVIVRWICYRPDPPLTASEWRRSFYRHGAWKLSGLGALFMLAGLAATWAFGVMPVWRWSQAQTWSETTCVVVEGRIRWSPPSRFPLRGGYVMDMAFAYQSAGRQYVSATYSPWRAGVVDWRLAGPPRDVVEGRVVERTEAFALGTTHRCYVSSDDPTQAYMEREWWNGWYAVASIGPGFALFGLMLIMARPRR